MPPKKRSSGAAGPPAKVATPTLVCRYATEKNPCQGECTRLKEMGTKKPVVLCPMHRKCMMCRSAVESGKFGCGFRQVACCLPAGTPNRLQATCGFRCGGCQKFFLKCDLAEVYYDTGADDNEKLFCDDCLTECALCNEYALCNTVRYGDCDREVCPDCVPDDGRARVTMTLVVNDGHGF